MFEQSISMSGCYIDNALTDVARNNTFNIVCKLPKALPERFMNSFVSLLDTFHVSLFVFIFSSLLVIKILIIAIITIIITIIIIVFEKKDAMNRVRWRVGVRVILAWVNPATPVYWNKPGSTLG